MRGTQVSKMGNLGPGGDTGTVMASLPHFQAATESQVLGAARPGTKPSLPSLATQKAAKGSSLQQNTPSLASHVPHCPQHWSCSCSYQSSWLGSRRDINPALRDITLAPASPFILWQRPLSLGGEGCPEWGHIWLAVKAGEPWDSTQRHPAAQSGVGRCAWTYAG